MALTGAPVRSTSHPFPYAMAHSLLTLLNDNLTLHLKQLEKEEMKNPTVNRRKEILKIRAEINAKEKGDHSKNQQSQKLVL